MLNISVFILNRQTELKSTQGAAFRRYLNMWVHLGLRNHWRFRDCPQYLNFCQSNRGKIGEFYFYRVTMIGLRFSLLLNDHITRYSCDVFGINLSNHCVNNPLNIWILPNAEAIIVLRISNYILN
jgi:hypothetical protein